jgi:hypothetical protein
MPNEPVMFKFFTSVEGSFIVENGIITHVEDYDFEAYFKAQGWLSPEDQQPFCMESAIELGYNFPRNEYVLTCGGRTPQFATGAYIRNHIDSVMTEYKGFFPTGFDGHQDPHETTRLRMK